jgi:hypothetical protein
MSSVFVHGVEVSTTLTTSTRIIDLFAQHVLEEGHNFDPMNEIMEVVHVEKKGKMLDTLEKFYRYRETTRGNQINDKITFQSHPIFEALVQHSPHRGLQLHT